MTDDLVCWKCGAPLADEPLPLARAAECKSCRADLHVCRLCEFYDPRVAKQCREPIAEEVKDKERSNFCGYFKAMPGAFTPADRTAAEAARSGLDALFTRRAAAHEPAAAAGNDPSRRALDRLFDLDPPRGK